MCRNLLIIGIITLLTFLIHAEPAHAKIDRIDPRCLQDSWSCSDWSNCISGQQTRTCTNNPYIHTNCFSVTQPTLTKTCDTPNTALDIDIGLRVQENGATQPVAIESPSLTPISPLKIYKNGTTHTVALVEPTDPAALKTKIKTTAGVKALKKFTGNNLCTGVACPARCNVAGNIETGSCDATTGQCVYGQSTACSTGCSNGACCSNPVEAITSLPTGGQCGTQTCDLNVYDKCKTISFTPNTCPNTYECIRKIAVCGNNICEDTETPTSCPQDCNLCTGTPPEHSVPCSNAGGWNPAPTEPTPYKLLTKWQECGTKLPCQRYCPSFTTYNANGTCVPNACLGNIPANARLCAANTYPPNNSTYYTTVSACNGGYCKAECNPGFIPMGNYCGRECNQTDVTILSRGNCATTWQTQQAHACGSTYCTHRQDCQKTQFYQYSLREDKCILSTQNSNWDNIQNGVRYECVPSQTCPIKQCPGGCDPICIGRTQYFRACNDFTGQCYNTGVTASGANTCSGGSTPVCSEGTYCHPTRNCCVSPWVSGGGSGPCFGGEGCLGQ